MCAAHMACTVEMTNLSQQYEVAVIDEIQMVRDYQRGWARTRTLLGVQAEEVHVCGEGAAVDLVREIMISTGRRIGTGSDCPKKLSIFPVCVRRGGGGTKVQTPD